MPSQFQPYYPVRRQPAAAATPASGQGAGSSIDKLLKAIFQQRQNTAAQDLANQPDNLGTLGDEGLIAQINQSPSAVDNLGVLGDESLIQQIPGSYY